MGSPGCRVSLLSEWCSLLQHGYTATPGLAGAARDKSRGVWVAAALCRPFHGTTRREQDTAGLRAS